jgi:putative ABC transport system substrate-binding protein
VKAGNRHEATGNSKRVKVFGFALCALLFAIGSPVGAQQATKIPRIGIVSGNRDEPGLRTKIFGQALQELGYIEGKNIRFDYRYTEGNRDRVPGIVAELVSLRVDVLFSTQAIVVRAAKQATKTVPIVMAITPDPVVAGLVDSLARPGGNITGLTSLARDLSGKRLELLTEMVPRLSRVGILTVAGYTAFKDYEDAARTLKVPLQKLEVRVPTPDLYKAFQVAVKENVSAIIPTSVPGLSKANHRSCRTKSTAGNLRNPFIRRDRRPRILWREGRRNF